MPKTRTHTEWFRPVSLGNRKSCPCCKMKLEPQEKIWSWGQYIAANWRTIIHFCKNCYADHVLRTLHNHTDECGCTVTFNVQGTRPTWLKEDFE